MPQVFPVDAAFAFNGNRVTDHNRSAISINPERIENRRRMADGTLRIFFIDQKKEYKVSWNDLPAIDSQAADGFWAAHSIRDFYEAHEADPFTLTLTYGNGATSDIQVIFKSFSMVMSKRNKVINAYYDVDLSVEEV